MTVMLFTLQKGLKAFLKMSFKGEKLTSGQGIWKVFMEGCVCDGQDINSLG